MSKAHFQDPQPEVDPEDGGPPSSMIVNKLLFECNGPLHTKHLSETL